ncbi:MAG: histidine--tRNA ligase [Dehalococcoidia bacterium]|nr:histidine--tRNA ligase [Dehalococcoidia bacterium]|tara:strand:- start:48 stop:1322 length:1275 start_codon:yes stop_codon:yes gene_type:complete
MSGRFQTPRGTEDILPEDQALWRTINDAAEEVTRLFGYDRIDTPTFEDAALFEKGTGDTTDIVEKEMYSFEDRGGDTLSLIPEATPAICRAYLEHGLASQPQPIRLFTIARMFRYNRPQLGRLRQFHQFDCEVLGSDSALIDAELIELHWRFYERLGLRDLEIHLGSIDDLGGRHDYLERLRAYYLPLRDRLSEDSQRRLERNPLRLLDSNDPRDQELRDGAPTMIDQLSTEAAAHFDAVKAALSAAGVPFLVDPLLVRGLDYYNRTVWEIIPKGDDRQQSSIGAGGRYDNLMETLGGKQTPASGFATGLERVIIEMQRQAVPVIETTSPDAFIVHAGEAGARAAVRTASNLREVGLVTLIGESGRSFRAQMRRANGSGARFAVIIGEDEASSEVAALKDLREEREQEHIPLANVATWITEHLS